MKKIFSVMAAFCMLCGMALAGDRFTVEVTGLTNLVTGVKTGEVTSGYIEAVWVDVPAYLTYTGTVTITTQKGETILSKAVTADGMYRLRVPSCTTLGATIAATTNERVMLMSEYVVVQVVVAATNNATTEHTVPVTFYLDNK